MGEKNKSVKDEILSMFENLNIRRVFNKPKIFQLL